MRYKISIILLFCFLIVLSGCERDILAPEVYTLENAEHEPLFNRDELLLDSSFHIGYQNGNIRSDRISFSWQGSSDDLFLYYKLYRDDNQIRTFSDIDEVSFIDEELVPDTYYHYMIATVLKTGMNKFDTLTVKTASIESPELFYSVSQVDMVRLFWRDRSDIPGNFIIEKDGEPLAEIEELPHPIDPVHYYEYVDEDVTEFDSYTYAFYKAGIYDTTAVATIQVTVEFSIEPPILIQAEQIPREAKVSLEWQDFGTSTDQYNIYRRFFDETDDDFEVIAIVDFPETAFVDSLGLEYSTQYTYAVTSVNNHVSPPIETDYSNRLSVDIREEIIVTIGTGTNVNTGFGAAPVNIFYRSCRTQSVYTITELEEAGLTGAYNLIGLAYYIAEAPQHDLPDFRIRMRHTSANDASAHIEEPYEEVYISDLYSPAEGNWDVILFDIPFEWNGIDNILIDTAFSQVPAWVATGQQRIFSSPLGMRFVRSDVNDVSFLPTTEMVDYKPQVQLIFEPITNYARQGGQK